MLGNLHVLNGTARRSCNSLTSWVTGLSEFLGWVGSGTLTNGISFAIRGENPSSTDGATHMVWWAWPLSKSRLASIRNEGPRFSAIHDKERPWSIERP